MFLDAIIYFHFILHTSDEAASIFIIFILRYMINIQIFSNVPLIVMCYCVLYSGQMIYYLQDVMFYIAAKNIYSYLHANLFSDL